MVKFGSLTPVLVLSSLMKPRDLNTHHRVGFFSLEQPKNRACAVCGSHRQSRFVGGMRRIGPSGGIRKATQERLSLTLPTLSPRRLNTPACVYSSRPKVIGKQIFTHGRCRSGRNKEKLLGTLLFTLKIFMANVPYPIFSNSHSSRRPEGGGFEITRQWPG
jgi:hypothetical protein